MSFLLCQKKCHTEKLRWLLYIHVYTLGAMQEIRFTWRRAKAAGNLRKHGLSFDLAARAFFDPHLLVVEDCIDERGEIRYHAIGYCDTRTLTVVVFVDRSTDDQEILHIISARKADKYEQAAYSDQFA